MKRKMCPTCLSLKPLDEFKITKQKGKMRESCDKCRSDYYKTYNKKRYASPEAREAELKRGREKYARIIKNERQNRKRKLIILMGGKCSICGYCKSSAALDFDHIDPTTKARTVSHLLAINQPWAWEQAIEEAKKCRLLCSNCHREITFPGHELESEDVNPPTP